MSSTLNGITCLGYRESEAGFEAVLRGVSKEDILAIDPLSLDIAAEDGHVVESFRGFGPVRKITEDLNLDQFTVLFPREDTTAQRVTEAESLLREQQATTGTLEEENALLKETTRVLRAQMEASQLSAQMLEDCLVEMAEVIYA